MMMFFPKQDWHKEVKYDHPQVTDGKGSSIPEQRQHGAIPRMQT
jgi:hypothetical protein